jgi:hypothetical protein
VVSHNSLARACDHTGCTTGGFQDEPRDANELRAAATPNDDLYDRYQWNLRQIRAPEAWDLTTGSVSTIVAVLDTGVSASHPDLVRKLMAGYDFVNDDATPDDDHGNGTHVAGIIAADTNNRSGVAGVSWQARILPVKVLDANARGDPERAARGVLWAMDHGANVINLGLAGPNSSPELEDAIAQAYQRGVVVVAPVASIGSAEPSYPAASPHVIAVAATDRQDRRLSSSNTGEFISVAAPGEQIASTFKSAGGPDTYAVASSTAQAAAHVSGLAALLLAINPDLKPDQVRAVIESSADDVAQPGWDAETGYGRINTHRAVRFAAPWNFNPRGAASYISQAGPASVLYFPLVMKEAAGWTVSLTIQNASARPASLTVELIDQEGRTLAALPSNLPAHGSTTFQPAALPSVPSGFVGAAVVRSDAPVTGVANQDASGRDRLSYEAVSIGANPVWIPLVMRAAGDATGDWDTGLQVQNLGRASASVRLSFTGRGDAVPTLEVVLTIPSLASRTFLPSSDLRIPAGWVGSAVVRSTDGQPLAVVANSVNSAGLGMSYLGLGQPSGLLFAPLIFKDRSGWVSGVQVQNTAVLPATIVSSYQPPDGSGREWSEQGRAEPSGAVSFYPAANLDVPGDFIGVGTARSLDGQGLAGVVSQLNQGGEYAAGYGMPVGGSDHVFLPLVYSGFSGWDSGIQVENVGSERAAITITFYGEDGTEVASLQDAMEPSAAQTYYLPSTGALPFGFVGSAVVRSAGQPLIVICNHVK